MDDIPVILENIHNTLNTNATEIKSTFDNGLENMFDGIVSNKDAIDSMGTTVKKSVDNVEKATVDVSSKVKNVGSSIDTIMSSVAGFAGDITGSAMTVWGISETLGPGLQRISDGLMNQTLQLSTVFTNSFRVFSTDANDNGNSDGIFVRLLRNLFKSIINNISSFQTSFTNFTNSFNKLFYVYSDSINTNNTQDGIFVRFLRNMFKATISSVDGFQKIFTNLFNVYSDATNVTPPSSEGIFIRLLRNLFKTIVESITKSHNFFSDTFSVMSDSTSVRHPSEGIFVRLLRNLFDNIIKSLTNISDLFKFTNVDASPSPYDGIFVKFMRALMNPIQTAIKLVEDAVKNIKIGDISFPDFSFNNVINAITNGFSDLSKQLGNLFANQIFNLSDMLKALIIPENMNFVNEKFNGLSDKFKTKFPFFSSFINLVPTIFKNQVEFEDIALNLSNFNSQDKAHIPLSQLNQLATFIKPILTSFFVFWWLYDKYLYFFRKGELIE